MSAIQIQHRKEISGFEIVRKEKGGTVLSHVTPFSSKMCNQSPKMEVFTSFEEGSDNAN